MTTVDDTETDFCVVGAGPAGLTLALLLLRSGCRVTLIERTRSFQRDFRGEILQPGGMLLLEELGVLGPARARGGYELSRFQLVEQDRVLMDIDYQQLPDPYTFLLSIPQRHLLEELLRACQEFEGFEYVEGSSVTELVTGPDERVCGVQHGTGTARRTVRAHCTIGADGRYSKIRKLSGLGYTRLDVFQHDVLWFKVPAGERSSHNVRVYRGEGNPVLIYDSFPDSIQIGWTLHHRGYREVAARGVEYVREQIARAVPIYAEAISNTVRELTDLSLLDVFAGTADGWVRDGLVLIGDSAHTHGPIGAQGINLAIQDAVLLHPVLIESLRAGDASGGLLRRYEDVRRPDIDAVMKLQARQGKALLSQGGMADAVRPAAARLLARTPLYRKVLQQIAFGRSEVRVRSDMFTAEPARRNATLTGSTISGQSGSAVRRHPGPTGGVQLGASGGDHSGRNEDAGRHSTAD